jgi:hypothetical protein
MHVLFETINPFKEVAHVVIFLAISVIGSSRVTVRNTVGSEATARIITTAAYGSITIHLCYHLDERTPMFQILIGTAICHGSLDDWFINTKGYHLCASCCLPKSLFD